VAVRWPLHHNVARRPATQPEYGDRSMTRPTSAELAEIAKRVYADGCASNTPVTDCIDDRRTLLRELDALRAELATPPVSKSVAKRLAAQREPPHCPSCACGVEDAPAPAADLSTKLATVTAERDRAHREIRSAAYLLLAVNKHFHDRDPMAVTAIDVWLAERAPSPSPEVKT
jgi:hypothetical protein